MEVFMGIDVQGLKLILARLDEVESLAEVRGFEDEVGQVLLRQTDEKVRGFGERLFAQIGRKRAALLQKEVTRLDGRSDLISKVARLGLLRSSMTFEELEEEVGALQREVSLEDNPRVQAAAFEQLESLEFSGARPLAQEFDETSVDSTFMSRIGAIAKRMQETNSLAPFKEDLNGMQQREVLRYAKGG